MNLQEFLSHELVALPITRDSEDFVAFVTSRLRSYLDLIDKLSGPGNIGAKAKAVKPMLEKYCSLAIEGITAAFAGLPHDSYAKLTEALGGLLPYLEKHHLAELTAETLGIVYRVRLQVSPPLTREQLFHVPFEARHKVATQRYSVPGLPCLYLSGSLFTCWSEMGTPAIHELQASAFWLFPPAKVKVINFTNRPARLARYLVAPDGSYASDKEDHLLTHIVLWPLMALCSIAVRHRDAAFKPEYIVPQVLLQWITKEKRFDGVCYFSTHVQAVSSQSLNTSNLVFPVREIKATGRCSWLRGLFKMTEPMSWQLLRAINMPGTYAVKNLDYEFIPGKKENYCTTEFGIVEAKLDQLAIDVAQKNAAGDSSLGTVLP